MVPIGDGPDGRVVLQVKGIFKEGYQERIKVKGKEWIFDGDVFFNHSFL